MAASLEDILSAEPDRYASRPGRQSRPAGKEVAR
jgi:hypothetical protein